MSYSNQNSVTKSKRHANSTSILRRARRKMSFRRKKLSVVQPEAGGKKKLSRDGLKGKKLGMKKIKEYCYWLAVNDILEGHGVSDTFEQRRFITRRKMSFRRKKLPVVQVEARRKKHQRKFSPVRIFRRDGLKGQKLQYLGMKKLKECYWSAVNDILEGSDTFDQRLVANTSFAIPVMCLSCTTFPNHHSI
ncbi:hypothetical protein H5410_019187 [Solanum commersonii]|uniref:Uncharacterized protein n=1 Tax=Solanum commersonii TaxID=4109 RepID=A0A9J6A4Z9_SOLCO|nr:hypothetical protein H5410_019187 [Solanum commersonii]